MHLAPSEGLPRNVAAPVVDMLYPPGKPFTIPIIAVTGTNGKTTTTRLISHIVKVTATELALRLQTEFIFRIPCCRKAILQDRFLQSLF